VARSSSAQKIARLAERGKGKKVRFQGGSVFPTVILVVCLLGAVLIAYARQSQPTVDAALGVDIGAIDPADPFSSVTTDSPIAVINNGVVGWMPQVLAGQRNAKLGAILDLYGIKVTDDEIVLPESISGGETLSEADTKCGDADATIQAFAWNDGADASNSQKSIVAFDGVKLASDRMSIVLAFVAEGTEVPMPIDAMSLLPQAQPAE
jgi:hypothetical protein